MKNKLHRILLVFFCAMSIKAYAYDDPNNKYSKAIHDGKNSHGVLWLVVAPKEIKLNLPDSHVKDLVVHVEGTTEVADNKTLQDALGYSAEKVAKGVLILVDFSDPLLTSYGGRIAEVENPQVQTKEQLEKLYNGAFFALTPDERAMAEAANAYRAKHGRGPLKVSKELTIAAREFTNGNYKGHPGAKDAATRVGLNIGRLTEIICETFRDPAGAVAYWGEPGVGHEMVLRGLINMNSRWIDGGYHSMGVAKNGRKHIIFYGY